MTALRWVGLALLASLALFYDQAAARAQAEAAPREDAQDFVGDWHYRWGDSPRDASGQLVWAQPPRPTQSNDSDGWQHLGVKLIPNAPGRNGQRYLWLRTQLSGPEVDQPMLYIGPVNQLFEVFLDGDLVYRFGQIDGEGPAARRFAGYPMHFIPLRKGYQGRTLTLRVYSRHVGIGIASPQRVGSKVRIVRDTLRHDLSKAIVAIVLCAVGVFVLLLFLSQRHERNYLAYAVFSFGMGIQILCQMRTRNFIVDTPLIWTHVEYFTLYISVASLGLFLLHVLGRGPLSLLPILTAILGAYPVVAALAVATGLFDIMRSLVLFQYVLLVASAYLLLTVVAQLRRGNTDARLFAIGLLTSIAFAVFDVLGNIGVLPRRGAGLAPFGQGLFVLSLGLILVLRFRRVHSDLIVTKQALSEKLTALETRNAEIEHLNAELRHQIEARSKQLVSSLGDASSSSQETVPIFPEGELINERYKVLRMLGQGAMGVVYEVERVHDGKRYAAKVLANRARRRELARFAREAQLLARLKHENLVSIADVDVTGNRLAYIIMELVDGTTLEAKNARYGDLSFVLPILQKLADALKTIHAEGIVHRDLKPANILVARAAADAEPSIKVVDFGVSALRASGSDLESEKTRTTAKEHLDRDTIDASLDGVDLAATAGPSPDASKRTESTAPMAGHKKEARSENLTQTGVIMGTPLYMAPELIRGARLAQPASDMFSFGVIAFELLTTQLPSETPPMLLPLKPLTRWYTALAVLCPDLPEHIGGLIERCLDAAPTNRPTAVEISAALTRWTLKSTAQRLSGAS